MKEKLRDYVRMENGMDKIKGFGREVILWKTIYSIKYGVYD